MAFHDNDVFTMMSYARSNLFDTLKILGQRESIKGKRHNEMESEMEEKMFQDLEHSEQLLKEIRREMRKKFNAPVKPKKETVDKDLV